MGVMRPETRATGRPGRPSAMAGAMAAEEDGPLLARFAARRVGDDEEAERAFAELVRRHGPMVLGVCRHLLREPHDADDAFQATFLVLARKAGSIDRPGLLAHWLHGVAVRVSRRSRALHGRRRRIEGREVAMLEAEPVGDPGRHDLGVDRREAAEAIHEEIARLPEKYRAPVVLCDLGGLTHAEAARRLRWPTGSLSVRLMRARDLLRHRLERRGLAPSAGLLAAAPMPWPAPAELPPALATATARSAIRFAGGPAPAASAAGLAGHALSGMALAKAATAASALLAAGLGTLAVGLVTRDGPRPEGPPVASAPEDPVESPPRAALAAVEPPAPGLGAGSVPVPGGRPEPESKSTPSDASRSYPALAREAGRDADAHVRLALWCESRGLAPERLRHLHLAALIEPGHVGARGLLGQVSFAGRWRRAEDVGGLVRADDDLAAALAAYDARRRRTPPTADAQWKLALWCEQKGLKVEATAHLDATTRLDPDHELARKRLGYRRAGGRWMTDGQVAEARAEAVAQREGIRRWRGSLARWRGWLDDPARRAQAEAALAGVEDPDAIPAVWAVFVPGGPADHARAVQLLGQIDGPRATFGLVALAVFSPAEAARRAASETLARRDPRDAVGLLVGLLRDPDPHPDTIVYRYQYLPIGALGIGSPGINLVEGRGANRLSTFTVDEAFRQWPGTSATGQAIVGSNHELRVAMQRDRQARDLEAAVGEFIAQAIQEFGPAIASARRFNDRVIQTLRNVTGSDRGDHWEPWKRWWIEALGYAYEPEKYRNPPDQGFFEPKPTYMASFHLSCFGAGTPVQTLTGPRPIESIRAGDRVLAQDPTTGGLAFEPVLTAFHNPPSPTLRLDLGGVEPVVTTGIHRFWKVGRGWAMARDLRPGDLVRTLEGAARVLSVAADPRTQPVYNLEVAGSGNFFAGTVAALVHDNSLVHPVSHPFDSPPELAVKPACDLED